MMKFSALNESCPPSKQLKFPLQVHQTHSYHLQRHSSSKASSDETHRQKVRLVENPFHVIVQNSIPTSLPLAAENNQVVNYKQQPNCKLLRPQERAC